MADIENLPRWILASVSKHFDDRRSGLTMFIEGQWRNTRELKDFLELRIDGPQYFENSKEDWTLESEVNVLVSSTFDENNYHRLHTNAGIVVKAFTDILVYRYGNGIEDDQSFVGCMKIQHRARTTDNIQVRYFGMLNSDEPIQQATVTASYRLELQNIT